MHPVSEKCGRQNKAQSFRMSEANSDAPCHCNLGKEDEDTTLLRMSETNSDAPCLQ